MEAVCTERFCYLETLPHLTAAHYNTYTHNTCNAKLCDCRFSGDLWRVVRSMEAAAGPSASHTRHQWKGIPQCKASVRGITSAPAAVAPVSCTDYRRIMLISRKMAASLCERYSRETEREKGAAIFSCYRMQNVYCLHRNVGPNKVRALRFLSMSAASHSVVNQMRR